VRMFIRLLFIFALALQAPAQVYISSGTGAPYSITAVTQGEVWVSLASNTNLLGTSQVLGFGTQNVPYSGDLYQIFLNIQANTTVHLSPGLGYVKGDGTPNLAAGFKMVGTGQGITTLRRDPRFSYQTNAPMIFTTHDDVSVSDVTLDAASTNGDSFKHECVALRGSRSRVVRITATGWNGVYSNSLECFPILVQGNQTNAADGGLISECEVSGGQNYVTGISLNSAGVIEKCRTVYPFLTGNAHPPLYIGYQTTGSSGAVLRDNVCFGGNIGFYTDTTNETDLILTGNRFYGVMQGITFAKSGGASVNGVVISGDWIELSTNTLASAGGAGITFANSPGYANNLMIYGCTVRYQDGKPGPAGNIGSLQAIGVTAPATNTLLMGNTWDQDFVMSVITNNATIMSNSYSSKQ